MIQVTIRSLQHYLYCPRRWGLIEIEREWQTNGFVAESEIAHKRSDTNQTVRYSDGRIIERATEVFSEKFGINGKLDQLEFIPDASGVFVPVFKSKYKINIIEFKPTKPKTANYRAEDAVQLYAQYICVKEMLGDVCKAYFYYADVKRRYECRFDGNIKSLFEKTLDAVRENTKNHTVPPILEGQYCGGCSFADICLPRSAKIKKPFFDTVKELNLGK